MALAARSRWVYPRYTWATADSNGSVELARARQVSSSTSSFFSAEILCWMALGAKRFGSSSCCLATWVISRSESAES